MTRWWWVRHGPTGRTDINGWTDVPADLSDTDALGRLAALLPEAAPVVSSDLLRARATADALAGDRPRLPPVPGLREVNFGAWEGRGFGEVWDEDPALARAVWETPGDVAPPGGESWNALAARVHGAVDEIAARLAGASDIVVVAHLGPILTQVQRARGCPPREVFAQTLQNLSLTRIVQAEGWRLDLVNHRA